MILNSYSNCLCVLGQAKIGEYRKQEIRAQWWIFLYDTFLVSCYIWSPILLSAGCLATYSLLYGGLTPSIAFTTIAILNAVEGALGILPELTTEGKGKFMEIKTVLT